MERITIELDGWRATALSNRSSLWKRAEELRRGVQGLPENLTVALKVLDRQVADTDAARNAISTVSQALVKLATLAGNAHQAAVATTSSEGALARLERSAQHLIDLDAAQGERKPQGKAALAREGLETLRAEDPSPYRDKYVGKPGKPKARCPWCGIQVETTKGPRRLMAIHNDAAGKPCLGTDSDKDRRDEADLPRRVAPEDN